MSDSSALEARIARLEAIEEISSLKARYCRAVDTRDIDAWAGVFTPDAEWDGGVFGRYRGLDEIRRYFDVILKTISFTVHFVTNPEIEVDGDRATGQWYLLEPCTITDGTLAVWGAGRYKEKYVRTLAGWKIQHLTLESFFWTPFKKGWVSRPFWMTESS